MSPYRPRNFYPGMFVAGAASLLMILILHWPGVAW